MRLCPDVMQQQDVDVVHFESSQASLHRLADALAAVVKLSVAARDREAIGCRAATGRAAVNAAPHFARDDKAAPGDACQGTPQPLFAQSVAVKGGRVEIADAAIPGRMDSRQRLVLVHLCKEVADGR